MAIDISKLTEDHVNRQVFCYSGSRIDQALMVSWTEDEIKVMLEDHIEPSIYTPDMVSLVNGNEEVAPD